MANDIQKYRAQFFQIAGFALMSPFGRFILDLKDMKLKDANLWVLFCFLLSIILSYIGIIFLLKGEEHLEEYKRKDYE